MDGLKRSLMSGKPYTGLLIMRRLELEPVSKLFATGPPGCLRKSPLAALRRLSREPLCPVRRALPATISGGNAGVNNFETGSRRDPAV